MAISAEDTSQSGQSIVHSQWRHEDDVPIGSLWRSKVTNSVIFVTRVTDDPYQYFCLMFCPEEFVLTIANFEGFYAWERIV